MLLCYFMYITLQCTSVHEDVVVQCQEQTDVVSCDDVGTEDRSDEVSTTMAHAAEAGTKLTKLVIIL